MGMWGVGIFAVILVGFYLIVIRPAMDEDRKANEAHQKFNKEFDERWNKRNQNK